MLLFLVLAEKSARFRILYSYTLLLKLPVLMCSCMQLWVHYSIIRAHTVPASAWCRIVLSFRHTTHSFCFRWARSIFTCAGGLGYSHSTFVKWADSSLPEARHDRFRLNRFIPSLWEQGIKLKLHNYRPRIVKYVWHTDDQCRLRAPKRLTSRGWVAWVVLGRMQKQ